MPKPKKRLKRADGKPVVIPENSITSLFAAIVAGLFFVLFVVGPLIYRPATMRDVIIVVVLVCLFAVLFVGMLGYFIWSLIVKPRLSIDHTAVRLLHGQGDVVGQLPYENIASVRVDRRERSSGRRTVEYKVLEIALIRRKDPDTWWPKFVKDPHYDVLLTDHWTTGVDGIQHIIQKGLDHHRTQGGEPRRR